MGRMTEADMMAAANTLRGQQDAMFASGPAVDVSQDPLMDDADGMRRQQDGMFGSPSPLSPEIQQQAVDNLRGTPRKLETLDRMGDESAPRDGQRGPLLGFSMDAPEGIASYAKDMAAGVKPPTEEKAPPPRSHAAPAERPTPGLNDKTRDWRSWDKAPDPEAPAAAAEAPRGAPAMGEGGALPPQFSPVVAHAGGFRQDLAGVTKGTMDARTKNGEAQEENLRQHGMTQATNQRLDAANYLIEADRVEREAAGIQKRRIERATFVQGKLDEREQLSKEMSETNLDGSKFWKNPGSIVMAVGAALFGRHEDLDKAIAQDLNMQKDAYARKDKRLGDLDTYVSKTREVNGDKDAADVQAEISAREAAITRIKSMAQNSGSQELIEKGEMAAKDQMDKVLALKSTYEQMMHYKPFTTGGGAAVQPKGLNIKLPDGRTVRAPNEAKYNEITTKVGQVSNIQANIDRALSLRKGANAIELANPYSAVRKQLESLQAETAQLVTVARGQGAMSAGDQEVANTAIGSMTGLMGSNDDVLRSTRTRFGEQVVRDANALGAEHVDTGYAYDAHGNLTPTSRYVGESDKPGSGKMPKGFKPIGPGK